MEKPQERAMEKPKGYHWSFTQHGSRIFRWSEQFKATFEILMDFCWYTKKKDYWPNEIPPKTVRQVAEKARELLATATDEKLKKELLDLIVKCSMHAHDVCVFEERGTFFWLSKESYMPCSNAFMKDKSEFNEYWDIHDAFGHEGWVVARQLKRAIKRLLLEGVVPEEYDWDWDPVEEKYSITVVRRKNQETGKIEKVRCEWGAKERKSYFLDTIMYLLQTCLVYHDEVFCVFRDEWTPKPYIEDDRILSVGVTRKMLDEQ